MFVLAFQNKMFSINVKFALLYQFPSHLSSSRSSWFINSIAAGILRNLSHFLPIMISFTFVIIIRQHFSTGKLKTRWHVTALSCSEGRSRVVKIAFSCEMKIYRSDDKDRVWVCAWVERAGIIIIIERIKKPAKPASRK